MYAAREHSSPPMSGRNPRRATGMRNEVTRAEKAVRDRVKRYDKMPGGDRHRTVSEIYNKYIQPVNSPLIAPMARNTGTLSRLADR